MESLLENLFLSFIDRKELMVGENACWILHVDVLVLAELDISLLDFIGLAIRKAFKELKLPSVVPVQDEQTGKVEVQLAEDIYEDQENTDSEIKLSS